VVGKLPVNLMSQKPHRGLNVLTLASQGYPSRFWLTFNQANKLGGRIRKGEKSSPVIYWNIGEEREYTTRVGQTRTSKQSFGSESYSREELVAEMGAAMLCGVTGTENRTIENSAAYLRTWIERLKSDSGLIVTAASAAQKAADYILGKIQTESEVE